MNIIGCIFEILGILSVVTIETGITITLFYNNNIVSFIGLTMGVISIIGLIYYFINMEKDK